MTFKKIAAGIMASVLILSSATPFSLQKVSAASDCVIDTATEYQTIKGFGGMNHPEWTGSDLTSAQRQKAFGNGSDELGMSIVRIYVNDDKNQWYKAVPTAKYVQDNGGIVFATPWNPPESMCETFTRTYTSWDGTVKTQENQKRLRYDKYEDYANHLNDFVHYMKDNGVNLYSISIQNEPDYGEDWTWMTEQECVNFLANYADKIDCPVMSPESFSYNKSYYNAILNDANANANTDIWGTHFYGTSRQNMDFPTLENDGREIFMTEVYVPNSSSDADTWPEAVQVAENIHNGLVVGNMNAYVWWYIRRSYGPMKEDGNISKRGYCMAQYAKFVRPGDVRIEATEQPASNVYVSAYKNTNNQVTIVAVNKGTEGYAQKFSVDSEKIISNVDRYRTSANESLAQTLNLEASENSFYAQLPAESVSTFVVTLSDKSDEPNEKGWYFDDSFEGDTCSWEARGSSSITLSGRTAYAGGEALLVQGRTSAWHGASKQLSTATFIPGKEYSFSVNVTYFDGNATDKFYLKLQYTDANGDIHYDKIAEGTGIKGEWIQLANTNYMIPSGASNLQIYVETAQTTNNFYIDEAIVAVAGTSIAGAGESKDIIPGDVNFDGVINVFDLALAKSGYTNGFNSTAAKIAADVDQSDTVDNTDIQMIRDYIIKKITGFTTSSQ